MPSPASFLQFHQEEYQAKIIDFLSSDVYPNTEEYIDFQSKYVQRLSSIVLDENMNDLLLYFSVRERPELMLETIRLMMSPWTKTLCVYPFYSPIYKGNNCVFIDQIAKLIKNKKTNLNKLDFNLTYSSSSDIEQLLKSVPTLKSLTIKCGFLKDEFMEIILKLCPGLDELDSIVSVLEFLKLQIDSWPTHESLRAFRIYVSFYGIIDINPTAVNKIFEKLPNLEIFDSNNKFINLFFSKEIPTNLKELLIQQPLTLESVQNLNEIFPETKSLYLKAPETSVLEYIPHFLHLKILSLYNCTHVQLMNVLEHCGSKLESLVLIKIDNVNLGSVVRLCPNLEHLDFHFCSRVDSNEVVYHSKLKHFRSHLAPVNIITLLKGLTSLEVLQFYYWPTYSPNNLEELITTLKKIKILHIYGDCNFTQNCIQEIIKRCHDLQELVLPSNNDLFNIDDVEMFIRNNNYCLNVINSSSYNRVHKNVYW